MPLSASLPVEMDIEMPTSRACSAARITEAMAPLCETMPRPPRAGPGVVRAEGERHAVDIVDIAEAVRPLDRHVMRFGDARHLVLERAALGTGLGEARGVDDDAADAARGAGLDRLEDTGARNRQHGAVDAHRQLGRRFQTRSAVDFAAVRVDQMDVARDSRSARDWQARPRPARSASARRRRSRPSAVAAAARSPGAWPAGSRRPCSLIALVSGEARPEALLVEELLHALVATALGVEEASLMALGHQILVRHLPRHALDVAHRLLGRA